MNLLKFFIILTINKISLSLLIILHYIMVWTRDNEETGIRDTEGGRFYIPVYRTSKEKCKYMG